MAFNADISGNNAVPETPMERLYSLISEDMEAVERLLVERAASPVSTIPDMSSYIISAGGKRLRPMITLAAAKAAGGRIGAAHRRPASLETA